MCKFCSLSLSNQFHQPHCTGCSCAGYGDRSRSVDSSPTNIARCVPMVDDEIIARVL